MDGPGPILIITLIRLQSYKNGSRVQALRYHVFRSLAYLPVNLRQDNAFGPRRRQLSSRQVKAP
jgi:hypothetical protein